MSELLVEPLLEDLGLDYEGLHVVAIGGGHGLAQALLAVQDYADVITAVVNVADDGGSSGRLAPALGIPPPGDIRRALLALSPEETLWRRLLEYRFEAGDVAGHSLGNLILAALAEFSGSFADALRTAGRLLEAKGQVVPVSPEPLHLEATIDGVDVIGQVAVAQARGTLEELRLLPQGAPACTEALEAISDADQIVIGPGSLFTSLASCLKVSGVAEAMNASEAQVIYVCNLTTQDGETLGMDAVDHVEALIHHAGIDTPDVVVANDGSFVVPETVEAVRADGERLEGLGVRLEMGDLADPTADWPQHDPARLGAILRRLA